MIASGDSSPGEHCNFISASRESWPCARRSCGSDCSEASSCFPDCDEVRFLCFALGLGAAQRGASMPRIPRRSGLGGVKPVLRGCS